MIGEDPKPRKKRADSGKKRARKPKESFDDIEEPLPYGLKELPEDGQPKLKFGEYAPTKSDGTPRKRRATKQETREYIDLAVNLLKMRNSDDSVKTYFASAYGMSRKWAKKYITAARKRLLAELNKPVDQHKVDAYNVYRSIIEASDQVKFTDEGRPIYPSVQARDRIEATKGIVRLLGLEAPQKLEIGQTQDTVAMENIRQLALKDDRAMELLIELSERMNGFIVPKALPASEGTIITNADGTIVEMPPEEERTDG